jgi:hypothetical protein
VAIILQLPQPPVAAQLCLVILHKGDSMIALFGKSGLKAYEQLLPFIADADEKRCTSYNPRFRK